MKRISNKRRGQIAKARALIGNTPTDWVKYFNRKMAKLLPRNWGFCIIIMPSRIDAPGFVYGCDRIPVQKLIQGLRTLADQIEQAQGDKETTPNDEDPNN